MPEAGDGSGCLLPPLWLSPVSFAAVSCLLFVISVSVCLSLCLFVCLFSLVLFGKEGDRRRQKETERETGEPFIGSVAYLSLSLSVSNRHDKEGSFLSLIDMIKKYLDVEYKILRIDRGLRSLK